MNDDITRFHGDYRWLSNFSESPMVIDSKEYATVEHYFQASKAITEMGHENVRTCPTPGEAKRCGRMITCRSDWEEVKEAVMLKGLRAKFTQNPELAQKLLDTGEAALIEGNDWGDVYWGVCEGSGKNRLGKLLMKVRQELRLTGV